MKDRDTPLPLVRKWEKMLPGVYAQMDHLHQAKADGEIRWPDYCQLPIGAAFTLLQNQEGLSAAHAAAGLLAVFPMMVVMRAEIEAVKNLFKEIRDFFARLFSLLPKRKDGGKKRGARSQNGVGNRRKIS